MLKIYIDRETEYIDIDYDIMFNSDRFAITGNWEYTEYTDAAWYKQTKQELLKRFGYPIDTPCELYESAGYTRIKNWKTA